jgi:hypothetical protein
MAGPSIGTWVKVRSKSGGTTPRVLAKKFGGGEYRQGEVITQSEYQDYKKVRASAQSSSSEGSQGKGSKLLSEFNVRLRNNSGLRAIAKAIDENDGVINTGKYRHGKDSPGMFRRGIVKVVRLNKPSKKYPDGSARVKFGGKSMTINLVELIDGIKQQLKETK